MEIDKALLLTVIFVFLDVFQVEADEQLVELLKNGGYLLNPKEKTTEAIQQELDHLKIGLDTAVETLKNETNEKDNTVEKSPIVFQIGIVVKEKKQTRRLDFIQWARQIGMRALALGKRYVGVSFELHSIRSRLYLFFVEEPETHGMDLAEGRNGLNTKIRDLFDKLKAEDTAQRSV